jgi:hypothetical protein
LARAGRWSAARLTVACTALVVLLGGTAAAAAAGELPAALQNAVSDLLNSPSPAGDRAPAPASSAAGPSVRPEPKRTGTGSPSAHLPGSSSAAGPTGKGAADPPQLAGLCRAYRAADPAGAAALLARPGFAPLVTAAGGVPRVAAFCAQVTGPARTVPPGSHSSSTHPSSTRAPSTRATGTRLTHPRRGPAVPSGVGRQSAADPAAPATAAQPVGAWQTRPGRAQSRSQPRVSQPSAVGKPSHAIGHSDSGAPVEQRNSRR